MTDLMQTLFGRFVPIPLNQFPRLAFQHVANRVQALQRDGSIAITELYQCRCRKKLLFLQTVCRIPSLFQS